MRNFLEKKQEEVTKEEHITFSDIGVWLSQKEKDIESQENELFFSIKEDMKNLAEDLKEQLVALEHVDLSKKKVQEKIKVVVKGNARTYAQHVQRFREFLLTAQAHDAQELTSLIERQLVAFDKKTQMNYQKATYLIGKEMVDTHESIGKFYNDMKKRIQRNKHILDSVVVINNVRNMMQELIVADKVLVEINEEISSYEKKRKGHVADKKKKLAEIEQIKKSAEHIENEKKKEHISLLKKQLSRDIQHLKGLIDFKVLANVFHSSPRKMEEVKEHKNSFEQSIDKDEGKVLLSLLAEANLTKGTLVASLEAINKKKEEIVSLESSLQQDKTEFVLEDIRHINSQMDLCDEGISKEKKRLVKESKDKEEIKTAIVKELSKIKVVVNDKNS